MPFFFPASEDPVDLRMRIGTKAGIAGIVIVVENVGDFLVPQSIRDTAEAHVQYASMSWEERSRYLLHLMLMAAEDIDSK